MRLSAILDVRVRRGKHRHLQLRVLVEERRGIQAQAMIQCIALHSHLVRIQHLWIHRFRTGTAGGNRVVHTALEASIVRGIAQHIVGEVMIERQSPGHLTERLFRIRQSRLGHRQRRQEIRLGRPGDPALLARVPQANRDIGIADERDGRGALPECRIGIRQLIRQKIDVVQGRRRRGRAFDEERLVGGMTMQIKEPTHPLDHARVRRGQLHFFGDLTLLLGPPSRLCRSRNRLRGPNEILLRLPVGRDVGQMREFKVVHIGGARAALHEVVHRILIRRRVPGTPGE